MFFGLCPVGLESFGMNNTVLGELCSPVLIPDLISRLFNLLALIDHRRFRLTPADAGCRRLGIIFTGHSHPTAIQVEKNHTRDIVTFIHKSEDS